MPAVSFLSGDGMNDKIFILRVICIVCLAASIANVLAIALPIGATQLNAVSTYRDLELKGVINEKALQAYVNNRFPSDCLGMSEYLLGNYIDIPEFVAWCISTLLVLIAVTIFMVTRSLRRLVS